MAAGTPGRTDSPRDDSPGFSGDEESTFTGHDRNSGKVLRIRRVVGFFVGRCFWHLFGPGTDSVDRRSNEQVKGETVVEVYRDPAVIASYLRRIEEKKLDYYAQHPELLAPTGNAEEDAVKAVA